MCPFQEWTLASQRLRSHFVIRTICLMTTYWEEQQPIWYALRLAGAAASPAAHEQAKPSLRRPNIARHADPRRE
jgi:hypothetical protein